MTLPDDLDHDRMAEVALALLSLTGDDSGRVGRELDRALLELLYGKGWIREPLGPGRSLVLTAAGRSRSGAALHKHFGKATRGGKLVLLQGRKGEREPAGEAPSDRTIVIRCTAELAQTLPYEIADESQLQAGRGHQWHARIVKAQGIRSLLFSHSETLYSFVMVDIGMRTLLALDELFLEGLADQLDRDGLLEAESIADFTDGRTVVFARSDDRRVMASMNDFGRIMKGRLEVAHNAALVSDRSLADELNDAPMGLIDMDSPRRRMALAAPTLFR